MSSIPLIENFGCVVAAYDSDDLGMKPVSQALFGRQRLPTEAMGNCTITLNNVVVGSRYRIEIAGDGTTVADGVASTSDVAVSVPFYAAGSGNNSLRIKVRKATSAPKYQPFESYITASAAGGTVYVAQVADPIA